MAARVLCLLSLSALLYAAPPTRKWHGAEVMAVHNTAISRTYKVIDSHDPGCQFWYREFRNLFRRSSISAGQRVQIAAGKGTAIYFMDHAGRVHDARLIRQTLGPPPPPPTGENAAVP